MKTTLLGTEKQKHAILCESCYNLELESRYNLELEALGMLLLLSMNIGRVIHPC